MSSSSSAPVMQSPLHPFELAAKAERMDASRGVWANEVPLLGYISLRGNLADAGFVEATSKALGARLPTEPCTLSQSAGTTVLWLSPDEWMIVTARSARSALQKNLTEILSGVRSQVADNSGGYAQVIVQGRNARDVLAHCTVYDLAHLTEGRVVGTTFGKSSVYVRRAGDGYCLLLRRSFADYIWRYLERAAQPYGFGIAKLEAGSHGVGS
jgi:sarcosine oxidase, subunit gamma